MMKKLDMKRKVNFQLAKVFLGAFLASGAMNSYAQHGGVGVASKEESGEAKKTEGRKIDPKNFAMMPYYALYKQDYNLNEKVVPTFTLKNPKTEWSYDLADVVPEAIPPVASEYPGKLLVRNADGSATCGYLVRGGACEVGVSCMNYDPLSGKLVEQKRVKSLAREFKSLRPNSTVSGIGYSALNNHLNHSQEAKMIPEPTTDTVNRISLQLDGKAILKNGKEVDILIEIRCAFTGKFKGTNPNAVDPTVADVQELLKDFLTIEASVVNIKN